MKKTVAALSACFFSISLLAQVQFNSLNEVLAYADKHSLTIKTARLHEEVAEKEEQLYRSTLKPRIDIVGASEYNPIIPSLVVPDKLVGGSEGKFRAVQFGLPLTFSSGLEISMPLFHAEKWSALKKQALEKERAKHSTIRTMEGLHITLAQAYYNTLLARELAVLAEESKKVMLQTMAVLEQRKKEGILSPVEYNRAKAANADVNLAALNWDLLFSKSTANLHQLLNIPFTDSLVLPQRLSIDWTIFTSIDVTGRPAYAEAKTSVMISEQILLQSKKATLPRLSLNGRYSYQWQLQKEQTVAFDMSSIGLRLDIPLFAGGYLKNAQQKAQVLTEAARLHEQQIFSELEKELSDWTTLYATAAKKQKNVQQKLAATADNLRIGQLSLKEGVMEFDDFNIVFQEWVKSRMEHLQILNEGLLYQFLLTQKL